MSPCTKSRCGHRPGAAGEKGKYEWVSAANASVSGPLMVLLVAALAGVLQRDPGGVGGLAALKLVGDFSTEEER